VLLRLLLNFYLILLITQWKIIFKHDVALILLLWESLCVALKDFMLCEGFCQDKSRTIVTTYFVDSLEDCVKLSGKIYALCAAFPLIVKVM